MARLPNTDPHICIMGRFRDVYRDTWTPWKRRVPIGKHLIFRVQSSPSEFLGEVFASLKSLNPGEVPLQEPMFRTSWVLKRMQWKPEIFVLIKNDANLSTIPPWKFRKIFKIAMFLKTDTVSKPSFLVSTWNFGGVLATTQYWNMYIFWRAMDA